MAISNGHEVNPFHDPRVFDALSSVFKEIIRSAEFRHESCIPGIVEDFNRDTHLVTVRPLVKHVGYDNKGYEEEPFTVNLWRFQIGGFLIDAPVYKGDVGWIIGSDRTTQNVKTMNAKIQGKDSVSVKNGKTNYGNGNQGPQMPCGYAMHKYREGFFIPDSWANIKIPKERQGSLLLQSIDKKGSAGGLIYITPEGEVGLESAKKGVKVKADVEATGDAKLDGTLTVTKDIVLGSKRISLSENDIAGKQEVKFRKVRFATGVRNGNLVYQTAYVLGTSAVDDGKMGLAAPNNNQIGGGGGADYRVESGDNSNVTFSVDGGDEQTYLDVNSSLTGKTVKMNVYYV